MKAFFAYFRVRFLTLIQYRTAAMAGVATQWMFGMMKVLVLSAFYANSDAVQPMSLAQTVSYIWIGQALLGIQPWSTENEIVESVLTGQVAYELTRPISVYSMWYARTLALRTAPTLLKSVPQFIIALFIVQKPYNMAMPSAAALGAWAVTVVGGILLSTAITNLMHTMVIFTVRAEGLIRFLPTFTMFFSGMIVPLRLMPDALQSVLRYQPFAGVSDLPSQIFCESLAPGDMWWVLGTQLCWTAILILAGQALMTKGLKRITVAGG